jgi:hypothetical protein
MTAERHVRVLFFSALAASWLFLSRFSRPISSGRAHQFFRRDAESLNGGGDCGPSVGKKLLAFGFEQQIARARFDKHAQTSPGLDQLFADQLLVGLENGEGINPIFGGDTAHRGQGIAFVEHAVENHGDDTIPKLSINWLTIIPLTVHPVFPIALGVATALRRRVNFEADGDNMRPLQKSRPNAVLVERRFSYSDIHNYITNAQQALFFNFFARFSRRATDEIPAPSDGELKQNF